MNSASPKEASPEEYIINGGVWNRHLDGTLNCDSSDNS
jgi:hypothetical protein